MQSGIDKITDWKGNIGFIKSHFKNSPLRNNVPLLLAIILTIEIAAGIFMMIGIYQIYASGLKEFALIGVELSAVALIFTDSKSQVTIKYDDNNKPIAIDAIVVSTQHDDFDTEDAMLAKIKSDVINILVPRVVKQLPPETQALFTDSITYHVNPTGIFVIGGPHGDTGLTGRKIIVDTYGGKGAHGGGAFSGKDPSKVDRSAAYATRHIAKNLVAAGVADEALVQVAYAIGVAKPMGLYVNTYGTSKVSMSDGEIADILMKMPAFDMRPYFIEKRFDLRT